ncbi:TraB/GumN family protein [Cognataquiflexum rubidum]|uniref:TraB/GumN family protein n=1 Tax=Cognataquiflexum rubidum TaxID=2922273 RepID=UPI001F12C18D|nr:TraB/GumN family protein [Cognataquiflexum rubidum]MCH6236672.1 TraB/GumN family protein [Cognataquiflexum rubidum]
MKKLSLKNVFATLMLFMLVFQVFGGEKEEKSLLWKISGNGLKESSYLFGTIHMICKDQFYMDESIENALASSKVLAMELNMADPNLMAEMQQLSVNPGFANIKGEFSPEQASALDKFLTTSYGAGLDQLGILKPFVLSSMVLVKMLPCTEQSSYELFLTEKAKEQSKTIKGLETVAFQMGVFDQIPQKLQIDELGKMVTNPEGMDEFDKLVGAYLDQDLDRLYDLITENDMFREYGNLLLEDRNKNWIPKIEEMVKEQTTFIAVGSGHLGSETGVIALLRKAGYTVEAVK